MIANTQEVHFIISLQIQIKISFRAIWKLTKKFYLYNVAEICKLKSDHFNLHSNWKQKKKFSEINKLKWNEKE